MQGEKESDREKFVTKTYLMKYIHHTHTQHSTTATTTKKILFKDNDEIRTECFNK